MNRVMWVLGFLLVSSVFPAFGQTRQTQEFHEKHPEAFTLFFYKSTIRMLDPTNSDEYFEMIKDIEKAKFLRFDESEISERDLQAFTSSLMEDNFEEGMTLRQSGATANIYIRDREGKRGGIILIMKSEGQVFILDIVGSVKISNLIELTEKINVFESLF